MPLFKWLDDPNHHFNGKAITIDTDDLPGSDMLSNLD